MTDSFPPAIDAAASSIPAITLEEMEGVKLLNRIDTKYLTDEATLLGLLADAWSAGYRVLEIGGIKVSPYNSIYYDTPGMKMFLDHHNRRLVRQKVRTREYVASGTSFLEIKSKNNHGRTKKKRIGIDEAEMSGFAGNPRACAYLSAHSRFTAGDLHPVLSTAFRRITLVNREKTERLTVDTSLFFNNFQTGKKVSLEDAVVIELKQDGHSASQMKRILLNHRVKPLRVSKYCLAVTLTDPSVKRGRFKAKVHAIEKVINKRIQVI